MKTKPYIFLIITAVLFVAVGCKKSSSPGPAIVLNGIYQAQSNATISDFYMYTKNGRITDQATINAYINKHPDSLSGIGQFILNGKTASYFTDDLQFNFLANGTVIRSYSIPNGTSSANFTITQRTDKGLLLEAVDTSLYINDPNSMTRSTMLIQNAGNLNQLTYRGKVPVGVNLSDLYTYRQAYPLIINNNNLYLSLYSCFISGYINYGPGNGYSANYSAIYNYSGSFNTALLKQLTTGDTLLYQNASVLLSKKN
jgi:hypothetical protein